MAERAGVSRRSLLGAGGIAAMATLIAGRDAAPATDAARTTAAGGIEDAGAGRVDPTGPTQAGVVTPHGGQSTALIGVYDLVAAPGAICARIGTLVQALALGTHPGLSGIEPGDLTVTVGVGPRLVTGVGATLPGEAELPSYPHEQIAERHGQGDVLLQVCASDPIVASLALRALEDEVPELQHRWTQSGHRGPRVVVDDAHTAPRNLLGFVDGIAVPTSADDLDALVWIGDGPATGGTIAVVRRMEIDVTAFRGCTVADQELMIGRRRDSSAPLSGGAIADDVDLQAKTADGQYRIPVDAHVRRANPTTVGVPLMLRRSYSMADPLGLLFISFQHELRTFTATMSRMAESDALLQRTTTTATGTYLILPGFDDGRPLGSTLFSA